MARLMRNVITAALIGTGYAAIMNIIAFQLGFNTDSAVLGWVFGVLAMGTVVMCDDYLSRNATAGGK